MSAVFQSRQSMQNLSDRLVQLRRQIHANPEYGFQEFATSRLIARTMRDLKATVREGVAVTGVVAELGSGLPVVAYMTAQVPGSMFWLGVTSARVPNPIWHSPTFDLDEDALLVGARVLAASARRLLKQITKEPSNPGSRN